MSSVKQNASTKHCMTNQLEFIKSSVMKAMLQHRHSLPFRNSSDGQEGDMDLATIKEKLDSGRYCSASECIEDFKLMFSDCYIKRQSDDPAVGKAQSLEKFLEAKLALMPEEEQEEDVANVKKPAKEISGLQDYMSSYFTPDQGRRSRRKTQHFDVDLMRKSREEKKRKSGEGSSSRKGKKKVFVQSLSPNIIKAHMSRQHKTVEKCELVARVHEKGGVNKLDEEVEELHECIVEEEVKANFEVEEEVIEVRSISGSVVEESGHGVSESESSEDWATQYTNSIRRFYKTLQQWSLAYTVTDS